MQAAELSPFQRISTAFAENGAAKFPFIFVRQEPATQRTGSSIVLNVPGVRSTCYRPKLNRTIHLDRRDYNNQKEAHYRQNNVQEEKRATDKAKEQPASSEEKKSPPTAGKGTKSSTSSQKQTEIESGDRNSGKKESKNASNTHTDGIKSAPEEGKVDERESKKSKTSERSADTRSNEPSKDKSQKVKDGAEKKQKNSAETKGEVGKGETGMGKDKKGAANVAGEEPKANSNRKEAKMGEKSHELKSMSPYPKTSAKNSHPASTNDAGSKEHGKVSDAKSHPAATKNGNDGIKSQSGMDLKPDTVNPGSKSAEKSTASSIGHSGSENTIHSDGSSSKESTKHSKSGGESESGTDESARHHSAAGNEVSGKSSKLTSAYPPMNMSDKNKVPTEGGHANDKSEYIDKSEQKSASKGPSEDADNGDGNSSDSKDSDSNAKSIDIDEFKADATVNKPAQGSSRKAALIAAGIGGGFGVIILILVLVTAISRSYKNRIHSRSGFRYDPKDLKPAGGVSSFKGPLDLERASNLSQQFDVDDEGSCKSADEGSFQSQTNEQSNSPPDHSSQSLPQQQQQHQRSSIRQQQRSHSRQGYQQQQQPPQMTRSVVSVDDACSAGSINSVVSQPPPPSSSSYNNQMRSSMQRPRAPSESSLKNSLNRPPISPGTHSALGWSNNRAYSGGGQCQGMPQRYYMPPPGSPQQYQQPYQMPYQPTMPVGPRQMYPPCGSSGYFNMSQYGPGPGPAPGWYGSPPPMLNGSVGSFGSSRMWHQQQPPPPMSVSRGPVGSQENDCYGNKHVTSAKSHHSSRPSSARIANEYPLRTSQQY